MLWIDNLRYPFGYLSPNLIWDLPKVGAPTKDPTPLELVYMKAFYLDDLSHGNPEGGLF